MEQFTDCLKQAKENCEMRIRGVDKHGKTRGTKNGTIIDSMDHIQALADLGMIRSSYITSSSMVQSAEILKEREIIPQEVIITQVSETDR